VRIVANQCGNRNLGGGGINRGDVRGPMAMPCVGASTAFGGSQRRMVNVDRGVNPAFTNSCKSGLNLPPGVVLLPAISWGVEQNGRATALYGMTAGIR
jgi:hypothetical protein